MEDGITRIEKNISYKEFYKEFLIKNEPCVLSAIFTSAWRSRREWVLDGGINIEHLGTLFGDADAPVVDCSKKYFSSHEKKNMKLLDFLEYLQRSNDDEQHMNGVYYLKDWHFQLMFPDYHAYSVPDYFRSDWLNEFWDTQENLCDDYRFVYIGSKGSWTPLHADVFRSFSWSANICGMKKWYLFKPGEEDKLKDVHGNLQFDIRDIDPSTYPHSIDADCLEFVQNAGEIVFVPSGWHHQVHNLEATISINHNWVNAACLPKMWQYLRSELVSVKNEIADCHDMENWAEQCQLILKTCAGIDYSLFFDFLHALILPRLQIVTQKHSLLQEHKSIDELDASGILEKINLLKITDTPKLCNNLKSNSNFSCSSFNASTLDDECDFIQYDLNVLSYVLREFLNDDDSRNVLVKDLLDKGRTILDNLLQFCAINSYPVI